MASRGASKNYLLLHAIANNSWRNCRTAMDNPSSSRSNSRESLVDLTRLNNLSDGVFAIALTLLAFDIRLPERVLASDLPNKLIELFPKLIVYLISFVVIGGAWGAHQRMLSQIRRGDGLLVWFNLFCLLFVALLPASAAVLGWYPNEFLAILFFALDVALIQLTSRWLWQHAGRSNLINPGLDPRVVKSLGRRLNLSTVIFALSIPLALWQPWITYVFWAGLFLLLFTTDWLSWQLAAREQQTTFPLDHARRASIQVQHKEGYLRIDSGAGENILLDGVFGGGLESHVDRSEEVTSIHLRSPERQGLLNWRYPWSWGSVSLLDWTLHLSDQIPLALEIDIAVGESVFELGTLQITDLRIKANTSPMKVLLPDRAGQTLVHIEADTSRLVILVPPAVAAHIHLPPEAAMLAAQIDPARFPMIEEGREYRSKRYRTASKRVDIRITGRMSSVEIV
jgi:uncharacterized membrane protein